MRAVLEWRVAMKMANTSSSELTQLLSVVYNFRTICPLHRKAKTSAEFRDILRHYLNFTRLLSGSSIRI